MFGRAPARMMRNRWAAARAISLLLVLGVTGCEQSGTVPAARPDSSPPAPPIVSRGAASPSDHDLTADEAMGGHTLARHVGKTDDELLQRLRREPDISSASTYTDRATAETVVGAALASGGRSFEAWRHRRGRRPNFALHFAANRVIGRAVTRGRLDATPCEDALVVVRWDDRRKRFYVLTSYPEARR
jgi:hypothetical protein